MDATLLNTVSLLVVREFKRVLKEPSRLFGILIQPLLFLTVFGVGFHESFSWSESSDTSYSAFFFPGILGLVVLFSTIYATLTLVEDKKCGLFRLVIISPSGVFGAVLGKVAATALMGLGQSCLFLPIMWFLGISLSLSSVLLVVLMLFFGSLACAVLGVLFAWLSPSSAAFHALMSVVLIPMWLLSGAMFPIKGTWFEIIGFINPMTYLVASLRALMLNGEFLLSNVGALMLFSFLISVLLTYALNKRPLE